MATQITLIDTFVSNLGKGSPTTVCFYNHMLEAITMQKMARDFDLPVTAFVKREPGGMYAIRYFTPTTEIPACGHATLAAAMVVARHDHSVEILFHTGADLIIKAFVKNELAGIGYPVYQIRDTRPGASLLESLGLKDYLFAGVSGELETLIIETDEQTLRSLSPDFKKLRQSNSAIKEVVVTSTAANPPYDFLLRSFCPWIGIDEDPVTGSIHAALVPFWSRRLGKKQLQAFQASPRGGEVHLRLDNDLVLVCGLCQIKWQREVKVG